MQYLIENSTSTVIPAGSRFALEVLGESPYNQNHSCMTKPNLRRHERVLAGSFVLLRWRGATGEARFARAKILNWSKRWVCVELSEPIPPRCYITIDAPGLNRSDWTAGSVRHCSRKGEKYEVGVELSTGADWGAARAG